jgi:P27 family predicted phage terminase small subunit
VATRGRKPTPTHLKLVTGNPGKRALPKREPQIAALPPDVEVPVPAHLCDEAKVEWGRIITGLQAVGLVTTVDRGALAACCQAYGRWVQAERALSTMAEQDQLTKALMIRTRGGNAIQNPLVGTANRAMELYLKAAAEFGMTPSARSRVSAGVPGGVGAAGSVPATSQKNSFSRNGRRPGT